MFLGIKVASLCIFPRRSSNTNPKYLGMNEQTDHVVQKRVCRKARSIQLRFSRSPAEGRSSSFKNLCTSKSLSSRFKLRNFSTTNWHLLPTNRNISHTALTVCHFVLLKFSKPLCLFFQGCFFSPFDGPSYPVQLRHLNKHKNQSVCQPISVCVCVCVFTSTALCTREVGRPASVAMLAA